MAAPQRSPKCGALTGISVTDLWAKRGRQVGCRWLIRIRYRGHTLSRAFDDADARLADEWALARRSDCLLKSPAQVGAERAAERDAAEATTKARLSSLLDEYLGAANGGKNKSTVLKYRETLTATVHRATAAGVDDLNARGAADRISRWLESLDIKDSTRGLFASRLRSLSRFAHRKGYTQRDVLSDLRYSLTAVRSPKPLTIAEARLVVSDKARYDAYGAENQFWLLTTTLLYTGLRLEAGRYLKWEDVTWTATPEAPSGTIAITAPTTEERAAGKGLKTRIKHNAGDVAWTAALQPELREIFADEARKRFGDNFESTAQGYIFDDRIRGLGPGQRRKLFERLGKRVGVDLVPRVIHDLRHTNISFLVGSGLAMAVVKSRVGHSQNSMITGHYSSGADSAELRTWEPGVLKLRNTETK